MSNYSSIRGVDASLWNGEVEGPEWDDPSARLEELYYDDATGSLVVMIDTDKGTVSLDVPIKACPRWNEFVDSLPRWSEGND
jgi:hypothetical protein